MFPTKFRLVNVDNELKREKIEAFVIDNWEKLIIALLISPL